MGRGGQDLAYYTRDLRTWRLLYHCALCALCLCCVSVRAFHQPTIAKSRYPDLSQKKVYLPQDDYEREGMAGWSGVLRSGLGLAAAAV